MTATRVVILRRYPTLYISEDVEGVHRGPEGSSIGEGGRGRRRVLSEVEEEVSTVRHINTYIFTSRHLPPVFGSSLSQSVAS